jgi:protein SCO1/2
MDKHFRNGLLLFCTLLSAVAIGTLWRPQDRAINKSNASRIAANLDRTVIKLPPAPLPLGQIDELTVATSNGLGFAEVLEGRWTLVFFGFTQCPHVCPMTMASLARAARFENSVLSQPDVQVVFVSVDPEHDTLERVTDYARGFSPDFVGVRAEPAATQQLVNAFGADFQYSIDGFDHSTALFITNPEADLTGLILRSESPRQLDAALEELIDRTRHESGS